MMRMIRRAMIVILVAGMTLSLPATADPVRGAELQRDVEAGIARLQAENGGAVRVERRRAGGTARFVILPWDKSRGTGSPTAPQRLADEFLDRHGIVFGITDPASQLRVHQVRTDTIGGTHVEYQQVHQGLPVFAGILKAHTDPQGRLTAVNGNFVAGLDVDGTAAIPSSTAIATAIGVVAKEKSVKAASLQPAGAELQVFRTNQALGIPGTDHLAWRVEVRGKSVREFVHIDAHDGSIVGRYTGIHDSLRREIYDGAVGPALLLWEEGNATPSGSVDVDNLIDYSEDTYNVFASMSNGAYLSWDGAGATMVSVHDSDGLPCPNARWNGSSTEYCPGVTADDTVAHEWGHAYTERTHGLIYFSQPGALNESYSDIWGEVIDFLNGDGTDAPVPLRGDSCSIYGGSPAPTFEVTSPPAIAGPIAIGGASFNPSTPQNVSAPIELVADSVAPATNGCESFVGFTPGNIALVDRGSCIFVTKVLNAQAAGASALIMINSDDSTFTMSGSGAGINIPSVMVSSSDGQAIKDELGAGVTGTITTDVASENSYRWLAGEDDPAFGGAIRDMWNPPCFGDPGRVSGPFYYCGAADNQGVHINSGVPNHGFALLVDGGTYNGQTIDGIGLELAAQIYWRAAEIYQTPTSDFVDHADSLEQACDDLIGMPLYAPITEEPDPTLSEEMLTEDHCAELDKAILAVELRTEPTQCGFIPILMPDAPSVCGEGTAAPIADVDWESGLDGWVAGTRDVVNASQFDTPDWAVVSDLPDDRGGQAAFVANLRIGACNATDDETGVLFLESPTYAIPSGAASPILTFDHWLSTELRFDGGNVRISVNGGPWTLLPVEAFLFNPYNDTINPSSTNPQAGEMAFTGADGGSLEGSWGQSQVDLSAFVAAGDQFQLRFEAGQDGCNGTIGWYLDDVSLATCGCESGGEPSSWYPDSDSDGFGDPDGLLIACEQPAGYIDAAGDCNDGDGAAWAVPGAAVGLIFGNAQTLRWLPPAEPGGNGATVDLIRSGQATDFDKGASCVSSGGTAPQFVDGDVPAPGEAFHYLVRYVNGCAAGSIGVDSAGTPRVGRTCP